MKLNHSDQVLLMWELASLEHVPLFGLTKGKVYVISSAPNFSLITVRPGTVLIIDSIHAIPTDATKLVLKS